MSRSTDETLHTLSRGYEDGRVDPLVQTLRDHASPNRPQRTTDPRDLCATCRLRMRRGPNAGGCRAILPAHPDSTWGALIAARDDAATAAANARLAAARRYRLGEADTCAARQPTAPTLTVHPAEVTP